MIKINGIFPLEILDSRGIPTIECTMLLSDGSIGMACVPSGASTGSYEAIEKRDGNKERFHGKGVLNAIADINNIIKPAIMGKSADQKLIDEMMCELDGTENKSRLGANAILAVSLSLARANAQSKHIPLYKHLMQSYNSITKSEIEDFILPMPLVNVLNGGVHADNNVDIQEFMLVPIGAKSFKEAIRMCSETFQSLKALLKKNGLNTNVGDEGGVAPNLGSTREVFDYLMKAVEKEGYKPGIDIKFAIDVAANELYKDGVYSIEGKKMSSAELVDYYAMLSDSYPIISIEDGLNEDDWEGWSLLSNKLGKKIQIVGDDLFVTNPKRLQKGFESNSANSILIKLNQIGSLTETFEVIKMAKERNWSTVISHRSGETEDSFIADLAVGVCSKQIKTGSTSRSERTAKYNQLIRIEAVLGDEAIFSDFGR